MSDPRGDEPIWTDEPRRAEEEMFASARRAQAELKRLIRNSEQSAAEWDEIFRSTHTGARTWT